MPKTAYVQPTRTQATARSASSAAGIPSKATSGQRSRGMPSSMDHAPRMTASANAKITREATYPPRPRPVRAAARRPPDEMSCVTIPAMERQVPKRAPTRMRLRTAPSNITCTLALEKRSTGRDSATSSAGSTKAPFT